MARPDDLGAVVVLLRGAVALGSWPLRCPVRPDLAVVDRVARWQLAARRAGLRVEVRAAVDELVELLDLVGLLEVVGEPERREQARVEEVVVADDPVA